MAKKWLLMLVEVDEALLPPGDAYTTLPDKLDETIASKFPSLEVDGIYLLSPKHKKTIESAADDIAINYHHYAVSVRGEKCSEENCEQHPTQNILSLHAYHKRRRTPSRAN